MDAYLPVLVMIAAGVLFGLTNLLLAERLGPRRPVWRKLTTYESGMEPIRTARERFSVKFYMVAMVFIVFDIEIVFMYPWAVQFRQLGQQGLWQWRSSSGYCWRDWSTSGAKGFCSGIERNAAAVRFYSRKRQHTS
jgi:NADH-quinone oxidoreductase subunit A